MARTALATSAQVLSTANMQNATEAGGSDVVTAAIEEAEEEVAEDYGDPVKKTWFHLDSNQTKYEFRTDRRLIYRIDRVWLRNDDNSITEYTSGTASESSKEFTLDTDENSITFASSTVQTHDGKIVEVHYVPQIIHKLVRNKAALYLLDQGTTTNGEDNTPTLATRIFQRIQRLEKSMMPTTAVGSEDEINYDPTRGEYVPQRRFVTY